MRSTRVPDPDPSHRPAAPRLAVHVLSLSGVFPLGAFLLLHLAVNARALRGDAAFARAVGAIQRAPAVALFEWLLVFGPLLAHASIGLWLVATRRPLAGESPYPPPVRIAVRATGVAAAAFLAMHLSELRFRATGVRLGGGELATVLNADLSSVWHGVPWRGAAYLAGTACLAFHFSAGAWAFAARARLGRRRKVRPWTGWAAAAFGVALWALLANVVVFRATGARLFGGEPEEEGSGAPCPARE
jgi:succinate dehydrogenase / fumarate reductase cytochrome b subunit